MITGFDRYFVALGYFAYMASWQSNGITARDRRRNRPVPGGGGRLMDTISAQLHRIGFQPGSMWTEETMPREALEIRDSLVARYERPLH